ncbi:MAG: hypothetical protein RL266_885 [Bacteroidota bacterium]|jgi:translation initiation factor 1
MDKKKPKTLLGLDSLGALLNTGLPDGPDPKDEPWTEQSNLVDASKIDLRVTLDKKQRNGKHVTLVTGFGNLHEDDVADLAKMLKSKCGVGGSSKNGEIMIQGDHVQKVMDLLKAEGFKVKRSGG